VKERLKSILNKNDETMKLNT